MASRAQRPSHLAAVRRGLLQRAAAAATGAVHRGVEHVLAHVYLVRGGAVEQERITRTWTTLRTVLLRSGGSQSATRQRRRYVSAHSRHTRWYVLLLPYV